MSSYTTYGCAWTSAPFTVEIGFTPSAKHPKEGFAHHVHAQHRKEQTYCAHMPVSGGEYVKTNHDHVLVYHEKSYRFRTCCSACADAIRANPTEYVFYDKDSPSKLSLRHRDTGEIVQHLLG